uniref:LON peptidase N-terminal domain and ring finger 3 n=1 Tax=Salarias fasciatus TaxID=181472 RepID=A0A672FCF2_SALFA
ALRRAPFRTSRSSAGLSMSSMLHLAAEAFRARNFDLAADIYECQLAGAGDPGTRLELMVKRADALAFGGKFPEAFGEYRRASEIERLSPAHLEKLVEYLAGSVAGRGAAAGPAAGAGSPAGCGGYEDLFSCRVCLGFLFEPVTLPCGHCFCRRCLERERPAACRECGAGCGPPDAHGYRVNVVLGSLLAKWFPGLHRAGRLRREGNGLYAEKRLDAALDKYNQAILIAPMDHILFSNRSQIHCSLRQYDKALRDAEASCCLMPLWSKGHVRRAQALASLGRTEEALREYLLCLSMEPDCRLARAEAHKVNPTPGGGPAACCSNANAGAPRRSRTSRRAGRTATRGPSVVSVLHPVCVCVCVCGAAAAVCVTVCPPPAEASRTSGGDQLDPSDLECSLCMRLFYEPVTTPCGHTFCLQCLERCLDHNPKCPLCKEELSEYLVQRRYCKTVLVEKLISKYLPSELTERTRIHQEELAELSNLNKNVPIFVCTMAFPTVPCPLHIFEPCYRLMVRRCMETGTKCFGMCLGDELKGFADYGCLLEIRDVKFFSDGRSVADTIGRRRFRVVQHSERDGYNTADIEYLEDEKVEGAAERELQSLHDAVYDQALVWVDSLKAEQKERIEGHFGPMPEKELELQASPNGPSWCWWLLAVLPLEGRAQLPFLALTSLKDRLSGIRKVLLFMAQSRHR